MRASMSAEAQRELDATAVNVAQHTTIVEKDDQARHTSAVLTPLAAGHMFSRIRTGRSTAPTPQAFPCCLYETQV